MSRKESDIPCSQEHVEHGEQMAALGGMNCQRRKMMAVVAVDVIVDDAGCNLSQPTVIRVMSALLITLQHLCNRLIPTATVTVKK